MAREKIITITVKMIAEIKSEEKWYHGMTDEEIHQHTHQTLLDGELYEILDPANMDVEIKVSCSGKTE